MQCEAQRAEDDSTFARCCSTHIFFCFSFELVSCCFTDSLLVVCFRQPNFIWTNRLNLPRLSSVAHQNSDSDTEIETFKKKKESRPPPLPPPEQEAFCCENMQLSLIQQQEEDTNIKRAGKWSLQVLVPHQLLLDPALACDSGPGESRIYTNKMLLIPLSLRLLHPLLSALCFP